MNGKITGIRKLFIAILFGLLGFNAFFWTPKDMGCYTALLGALVGLAGWFHSSNIQEHKIANGGINEK